MDVVVIVIITMIRTIRTSVSADTIIRRTEFGQVGAGGKVGTATGQDNGRN
jgi:hypothetical protein